MAFYIAGDKVKLVSSKKYGTVAAVLRQSSVLIYWDSGKTKTQTVASNLLEPNYGKRGK